jgi:nucleoid DNA-binding protein
VLSTQIPIEVEVEVVKPHFEVDTEARMVDIINMKVKLMKVNEETLEEEEVEEVVEVVVEVIEVNNQIATQIAIIMENLGTWQLLSKGT